MGGLGSTSQHPGSSLGLVAVLYPRSSVRNHRLLFERFADVNLVASDGASLWILHSWLEEVGESGGV